MKEHTFIVKVKSDTLSQSDIADMLREMLPHVTVIPLSVPFDAIVYASGVGMSQVTDAYSTAYVHFK